MEEPTAITFSRETDQLYADVVKALNGNRGYKLYSLNILGRDGVVLWTLKDNSVTPLPTALGQLVAQAL